MTDQMVSQKRTRHRGHAFRYAVACLALSATPALAAAQAQSALGNTTAAILALGLLLISMLAIYFFVKLQRQKNQIKEQAETMEHLTGERDEVLAELQLKTREIEENLSSQIVELERENEDLSAATAKLRKLVVVDELTQLSNRLHFDQVMPHEMKRALREEKPLSVIFGRFDWADAFRQSYGQERFDEAMQKIADEVRTIFRRAGDLPARYGNDTFAIIFTSDGDIAERFARRLCKSVWNIPIPHDASETADRVTFSIGVATVMPDKIHDPAKVVAASETAAKIATDKGGNQVERYRKPPSQPAAV